MNTINNKIRTVSGLQKGKLPIFTQDEKDQLITKFRDYYRSDILVKGSSVPVNINMIKKVTKEWYRSLANNSINVKIEYGIYEYEGYGMDLGNVRTEGDKYSVHICQSLMDAYHILSEIAYKIGILREIIFYTHNYDMIDWPNTRSNLYNKFFYHSWEVTDEQMKDNKWFQMKTGSSFHTLFIFYLRALYKTLDGGNILPVTLYDETTLEKFINSLDILVRAAESGLVAIAFKTDKLHAFPSHKFKTDDLGRMHCLDGPGAWGRKFKNYFIHGVRVPKKVVMNPEKITVAEIFKEENIETRRILIEQYGTEKFYMDANPAILDETLDVDSKRQLIRIDLPKEEPLVLVRVICPSTGRQYYLRVPPYITCADFAVAWTFGMSSKDYKPVIQT